MSDTEKMKIPEAAVEAAAKALAAADLVPDRGALYRYDARLALEAAAPHMLADAGAKALEDAADAKAEGQRPGFISAWLKRRAIGLRTP